MSEFKPIRTTSDNLTNISVVDGQFILTTDTGCIYVDFGSTRVQIGVAVNQGSTNSGKYLTVNSSGAVTNTTFPVASTSSVGGVKVDGTSITITNAGVISAADQLSSVKSSGNSGKYLTIHSSGAITATSFPVASTSAVGGVKVDGTIVSMDSNKILTINKNQLVKGETTNSIALGTSAATGEDTSDIAIGCGAKAEGDIVGHSGVSAIAIGTGAIARGAGNIQLGNGTNSNATSSFAVGSYQLLDLTNGIIPSARLPIASVNSSGAIKVDGTVTSVNNSNQLQISKNSLLAGTGTDSIAIGTGGSSGTSCIFIGTGTGAGASGQDSVAIGTGASASYQNDVAIGPYASAIAMSTSLQIYTPSLAIGYGAVSTGGGIQIGYGTNSERTLSIGFPMTYQNSDISARYVLLTSNGKIPADRLPKASTSTPGAVKLDGTSITIDNSGVIKAEDQLAYLKDVAFAGKYLVIDSDGDISAADLPLYNGGVS